jgi:hypothetical protein
MTKHRADIRPEWHVVQRLNVFSGGRPRLLRVQRADHVLSRHRLDSAEQIGRVLGVCVDGRQRAVAEQHRGDAMPHRLAQAGIEKNLGVVVRVHVDEARGDPLARRINHVGAAGLVQRRGGHGSHGTVANAQGANLRSVSGPVEVQAVANDHVVCHGMPPNIDSERSQSLVGDQIRCRKRRAAKAP